MVAIESRKLETTLAMKRYIPDPSTHAALCEANYVRLRRLLSDLEESSYRFSWADQFDNEVTVNIHVLERFKYTTTIQLLKSLPDVPKPLGDVELTVRIYDDARMAEVVTLKQGKQLAGVYPYPNEKMYQIDEKSQANHYLAEWLTHLLSHGVTKESWLPR